MESYCFEEKISQWLEPHSNIHFYDFIGIFHLLFYANFFFVWVCDLALRLFVYFLKNIFSQKRNIMFLLTTYYSQAPHLNLTTRMLEYGNFYYFVNFTYYPDVSLKYIFFITMLLNVSKEVFMWMLYAVHDTINKLLKNKDKIKSLLWTTIILSSFNKLINNIC